MRPASIVAKLADGSERTVAIRRGRGRWESAARVVAPWLDEGATVELRDPSGAVVAVVEADVAEAAEEQLATTAAREDRLLALIIKAQEMALRQHQANVQVALEAMRDVCAVLGGRLGALERDYGKMLRATYEATIVRAEAEASDNGAGDPLAQLAGAVLSHHPIVQGAVGAVAGVQGAASPPATAPRVPAGAPANGPRRSKPRS